MSYTLIAGVFKAVGFSPDGDSVRFQPDDAALVNQLPNAKITLLEGKSIQLRLECIDALETHFTSGSTRFEHQPLVQAMAAREHLLGLLGFEDVEWDANQKNVVSVKADDRPGYILSNTFDSYGSRPVSYAFAGPLPANNADGDDFFLTANHLGHSTNWKMVNAGYAYPMYYQGAFHDLRAKFDAAVNAARSNASPTGVWLSDVTREGFALPPDSTLTGQHALWPKLFRRVSSFFKENPQSTLAELPAWLEANRDECIDLDTGSWTALHEFVEWAGGKIRVTKDITRLMFQG